ncbi:MAG: hypothetical protein A2381_01845 [Bdellovibrionales bacterium RIFOXYB1_FULL_37_110]|nr:MAG: hypothetical protein A2417_09795 [Bdellovibrionales bacterium RIFOXYC1_FULL_37_79]OFZ58958.1 MAG: hypothetical protein A2381_01845 [Bdellovibrionales bacterium RIFOXYB1_FULL_37_110]OFZ64596.1 MAG: hypothetical protein A2577_13090 [Bdellovibrionales bacterium RIFOXYD1_FULL_36_51]
MFLTILCFGVMASAVMSEDASKKKVKVVYKKHTQLDFSGGEIRGKIKTPAVYYIFQRKRSKEHHVVAPVRNFDGHKDMTIVALRKSLNK